MEHLRVALVGAGPKGLYALERLTAHLAERPSVEATVDVFDRLPFPGAGPNYRPDQPPWLLLNFPVVHVAAWPEPDPRPRPLARRTPSFLTWLQEREPDAGWTARSLAPRALVGDYLIEQFQAVVAAAPPNVRIRVHRAEVTAVERDDDAPGFRLRWQGEGPADRPARYHRVHLALGHTPEEDDEAKVRDRTFAERHGVSFVRDPFPVDVLGQVPDGDAVATRGMGLTFIDVALTLTEGRGGRFERRADGALRYVASGREPARIVPFSPSGLLPSPKPDLPWPDREGYRATFYTPTAVSRLRDARGGGPLDWCGDVWPLLESEMELEWYRVLAGREDGDEIRGVAAGDEDEARAFLDAARARSDLPAFDVARLLDGRDPVDLESAAAHHASTVRRLAREIGMAGAGPGRVPAEAAAEVWNKVYPLTWRTVRFGGLTPGGRRRFAEIQAAFARRTFGCPVLNARKVLALAEAGILHLGVAPGAEARPEVVDGEPGWTVGGGRVPGATARVRHLVEARMPGSSVARDATPLVQQLRAAGLVRDHTCGEGDDAWVTGGVDVLPSDATVLDADGQPVEGLTAVGWTIEGPTIGNDTVARDVNDYADAWARAVVAAGSGRR